MVETSSSASLIAQANKFMDAIAEPMRLDEVLQTIDELERFKEDMRTGGVSPPVLGLGGGQKTKKFEEAAAQDEGFGECQEVHAEQAYGGDCGKQDCGQAA